MNGGKKGLPWLVFHLRTLSFFPLLSIKELAPQNPSHHIHIFRIWLHVSVNRNSGKFLSFVFVLEGPKQFSYKGSYSAHTVTW